MPENELSTKPTPHLIPVTLFARQTNKTTQLVNNSDSDFSVSGKHQWFDFEFEVPVFVTQIEVDATGYDTWNSIEFLIRSADGKDVGDKVRFTRDAPTVFETAKVATGFRFKPDQKWGVVDSPKIRSVRISGLTIDEFVRLEAEVSTLAGREKKLAEREARVNASEEALAEKQKTVTATVNELTKQKTQLESEVGKATAQLSELQQSVEQTRVQRSDETSKLNDIKSEIEVQRDERRSLAADIAEQESTLSDLTKDVRLFPSEIAGFVKEGNRSTIQFILLAMPFVAIIVYVTYALFSSSIDLTQIWKVEDGIDIWSIFLTRLPFVIVAVTILEVCGYVIGRFIFEVLKINRQRLNLSKLSIIAKDVTVAASHGTDATDEEIFERETKLKMELLREHMKEYVNDDFTYKGTAVQSAISAVVEKVAKPKSDV